MLVALFLQESKVQTTTFALRLIHRMPYLQSLPNKHTVPEIISALFDSTAC